MLYFTGSLKICLTTAISILFCSLVFILFVCLVVFKNIVDIVISGLYTYWPCLHLIISCILYLNCILTILLNFRHNVKSTCGIVHGLQMSTSHLTANFALLLLFSWFILIWVAASKTVWNDLKFLKLRSRCQLSQLIFMEDLCS